MLIWDAHPCEALVRSGAPHSRRRRCGCGESSRSSRLSSVGGLGRPAQLFPTSHTSTGWRRARRFARWLKPVPTIVPTQNRAGDVAQVAAPSAGVPRGTHDPVSVGSNVPACMAKNSALDWPPTRAPASCTSGWSLTRALGGARVGCALTERAAVAKSPNRGAARRAVPAGRQEHPAHAPPLRVWYRVLPMSVCSSPGIFVGRHHQADPRAGGVERHALRARHVVGARQKLNPAVAVVVGAVVTETRRSARRARHRRRPHRPARPRPPSPRRRRPSLAALSRSCRCRRCGPCRSRPGRAACWVARFAIAAAPGRRAAAPRHGAVPPMPPHRPPRRPVPPAPDAVPPAPAVVPLACAHRRPTAAAGGPACPASAGAAVGGRELNFDGRAFVGENAIGGAGGGQHRAARAERHRDRPRLLRAG